MSIVTIDPPTYHKNIILLEPAKENSNDQSTAKVFGWYDTMVIRVSLAYVFFNYTSRYYIIFVIS